MKIKLITIALTCMITLTAFAENIETPKAKAGTAAFGVKPPTPPPQPTGKDTKSLTVTPKGPGSPPPGPVGSTAP